MFTDIPEVRSETIAAVIVLNCVAMYIILTLVLMNSGLQSLEKHLGGMELRKLIAYLIASFLVIYSILLKTEKLTWKHLGLEEKKLVSALIILGALVVVANLVDVVPRLLLRTEVSLKQDFGVMFLAFGVELFGTAFFEEVTIRAFLLPQIYKKLGKQWAEGEPKPTLQLFYAFVLSHLVFVGFHIPILLFVGSSPIHLLVRIGVVNTLGVIFTIVYLKTRNLILTIGVHALVNAPLTLVEGSTMLGVFLFLLIPFLFVMDYVSSDQKIPTFTRPTSTDIRCQTRAQ